MKNAKAALVQEYTESAWFSLAVSSGALLIVPTSMPLICSLFVGNEATGDALQ
jgi:hypothetical protein